MRILHVIHDVAPSKGGPSESLLQLAAGYAAAGVSMEVLSLDPPQAPYLDRYPFRVHGFDREPSTFGYSRAAARWLAAHASGYDGMVIDGLWHYLGAAARSAALEVRRPYLVFPHGMLDPWFKRTYPAKHVKKQLFWWTTQGAVMRDAYRVVFTTEQERKQACGTFWPSRWRSAVIPLGIQRPQGNRAAEAEAFSRAFPATRGRRLLLFLSRLHPKKGCDLLLRAFAQVAPAHPQLDLVMAGPDPDGMRPALDAIVEEAGIAGRVHWTDMLEGEVKWGAFRAAEAFILPSHQENFGLVVAEALACGVPVLISNQINICNFVIEDGTGFVEPDTEAGTLHLIERWLALDQAGRDRMLQRVNTSFDRRFSVVSSASALRELIAQGAQSDASQRLSSDHIS